MTNRNATLGSQAWLAGQLGVSQSQISKYCGMSDWRWGRGPFKLVDVAAIAKWRDERKDEASDERSLEALAKNPERLAKIRLIIERTAKLKLERGILAGDYLKRDDVHQQNVTQVYVVRAKMQELPLRASLLVGKSEAEIERILIDWMREVCEHFATGH